MTDTMAVLGAGSWGTALAILLARNGLSVKLWGHDLQHIQEMQATGTNQRYLPGISLPSNLQLCHDLSLTVKDVQDILIVVPSRAFKSLLLSVKTHLSSHTRIVWGTKGMDTSTGHFLDQVAGDILGAQHALAVLSGPSFALDVSSGLPAAVTIASTNTVFAKSLAKKFTGPTFRVYTSQDVIGVEVCGVVKNILAIAAGISDGLGLGTSAQSALITRGLTEMKRLGMALGAKSETFIGLAGVGDLVLTCTDDKSRNRRFGKALALGKTNEQAAKEIGQVVEGIHNLRAIHDLIQKIHISMPITEQVYQVAFKGLSPQAAVQALFARKTKPET
ncbi:MAG: NAD(P)H-dependent glycerol-3-phosphate dehydrogenase [Gammaproteobacteria bacterium]|nr:NAD(P)H-dependent glycerol-3-phosphate dehydrogenase [Gammaproteobacteria bacterium]